MGSAGNMGATIRDSSIGSGQNAGGGGPGNSLSPTKNLDGSFAMR